VFDPNRANANARCRRLRTIGRAAHRSQYSAGLLGLWSELVLASAVRQRGMASVPLDYSEPQADRSYFSCGYGSAWNLYLHQREQPRFWTALFPPGFSSIRPNIDRNDHSSITTGGKLYRSRALASSNPDWTTSRNH